MLHGNKYKDVREAVALSLCGSDVTELQAAVKVWMYPCYCIMYVCHYSYSDLLQVIHL